MDLDNPSYFSVPTELPSGAIRKNRSLHTESLSSGASDCSLTPPRYSSRSFLRSISTNSADSNQELLIRGEPRLSDIAPDLAFKYPSRTNSLKVTQNPHADLMYMPLPTNEEAPPEDLSDGEVFLAEDSARYYNFKGKTTRRHSIGPSYLRERTGSIASSTKSFKEDFPQALSEDVADCAVVPGNSTGRSFDEHSLRHGSYPRKRCLQCNKVAGPKPVNMDDILIVSLKSSDAAALWVEYFSNYFQQISKQASRKPFKIHHMGAEDLLASTDQTELIQKTSGVKLQLVVLCPSFLDYIANHPDQTAVLGKILLPDRTLALLLGVSDNDLNDVHKKVLSSYFQWQRQSVGQDQDENFTKEFLGQAMAILSRVWKQQSSVVTQDKACFTVTPKKIRQGQSGIFILLTYPLQKEDIVKISIEKHGEMHEIKTVKRRNPYIMKIKVPEHLTEVTAIVNVLVEKNGNIIGSRPVKCDTKLRELEQILRSANNPVEFMCESLGFNPADKENLDNWLVTSFQRNLPAHFNLLANHNTPFAASVHLHKHSFEEFPTLLHFAAKFGLDKLSIQLLECPGADMASEIRNVHNLTPWEMAEAAGHSELSGTLRSYSNMTEFTNMYTQLKQFSQDTTTPEIDADGYLEPKILGSYYKMCPKPRPLNLSHNNLLEANLVASPTVSEPNTPLGYMSMTTPVQVHQDFTGAKPKSPTPTRSIPNKPKSTPSSNSTVSSSTNSLKTKKSKSQNNEDKVLQELAEIIMDFKNNVHSITQAEKLVEDWKNRNDVQKSFKEKQEQLVQMRLRYEQIQGEMQANMRKASPMDRIKKFFRGKSSHAESSVVPPIVISPAAQRPISSLSTSSSGSSGRMSTISGCSLGDSGTHSDNEERRNMLSGTPGDDVFRTQLNEAIMNLHYTPLPAPKPVKSRPVFETIEEKPAVRPSNLELNYDFYIHFPPSGLPVPGLTPEVPKVPTDLVSSPALSYINLPGPSADDQQREYMNYKVPATMTNN